MKFVESIRNYCNCSLQTTSLGSWISPYLSQVYSIFDFPSGPLCFQTHEDNISLNVCNIMCIVCSNYFVMTEWSNKIWTTELLSYISTLDFILVILEKISRSFRTTLWFLHAVNYCCCDLWSIQGIPCSLHCNDWCYARMIKLQQYNSPKIICYRNCLLKVCTV